MAADLPSRIDIPPEYTWNSESLFASPLQWEAEYKEVDSGIPALNAFEGTLATSAENLVNWFSSLEKWGKSLGRLMVYAGMGHSVDTADQDAAARYSRIVGLSSRFQAAIAFADPEILNMDEQRLDAWISQTPSLAHLTHYVTRLRLKKPHIRSAEIETLLGQISAPFGSISNIYQQLTNADMIFTPAIDSEGEAHIVSHGAIGALLTHSDAALRKSAYENYSDSFLAAKHTNAACLEGVIRQDYLRAKARNYPSCLQASMGASFIPTEVFHNLIDVFKVNYPVWHRYWELRRKVLKQNKLAISDCKAPLAANSPEVPFSQAVEWICEGMAPLGGQYVSTMRKGLTEHRWVDLYPNQGKRMGAFSSGSPGTYPFIMMSYNNDIFSLSTLAHELGHSMHSYLSWESQPLLYSHYGLFAAEVASNFNQAIVRAYLLKTQTDPDFQITLIEEAMSNFHRYFFIMPTLARFELEMHERIEKGQALNSSLLIKRMAELFQEAYGDSVIMDEERVGITWAQFGHLYSNFYVYQYATGISGANALVHSVLNEGETAAKRYLSFLSAGGSAFPLDALRNAGVDLAHQEPVERAFKVMSSYIDRLEKLIAV